MVHSSLWLSKPQPLCKSTSSRKRPFLRFPWVTRGGTSYLHGAAPSNSFSSFCAVSDGTSSNMLNLFSQRCHVQLMAFFCWPRTMISRTLERSIILVSISMMSGCSRAPLMNSSSVNSPEKTRSWKWRLHWVTLDQGNSLGLTVRYSSPSPWTSIFSYIRVTISSGGMS